MRGMEKIHFSNIFLGEMNNSTSVYNEVTCGNKHRHRLLKCYCQKIVSILTFQAQLRFRGLF